jgi:AraC family transcriptional regulator, regulatory protein of adaptative response / DNA-3-methyladenine glycosylase II
MAGYPPLAVCAFHTGAVPASLRLTYREPLCPDSLFGHLAATAVPGVEEWGDGAYRRTPRLPGGHEIVSLRPLDGHVGRELALTGHGYLPIAVARCRARLRVP